MSTTAQWVFDKAIYLMDEQNEINGLTETSDTQEYRHRTLGILNVLRHELYPISDTCAPGAAGKRSVCPEVTAFSDELRGFCPMGWRHTCCWGKTTPWPGTSPSGTPSCTGCTAGLCPPSGRTSLGPTAG